MVTRLPNVAMSLLSSRDSSISVIGGGALVVAVSLVVAFKVRVVMVGVLSLFCFVVDCGWCFSSLSLSR